MIEPVLSPLRRRLLFAASIDTDIDEKTMVCKVPTKKIGEGSEENSPYKKSVTTKNEFNKFLG
jgi:hypothetical protein